MCCVACTYYATSQSGQVQLTLDKNIIEALASWYYNFFLMEKEKRKKF